MQKYQKNVQNLEKINKLNLLYSRNLKRKAFNRYRKKVWENLVHSSFLEQKFFEALNEIKSREQNLKCMDGFSYEPNWLYAPKPKEKIKICSHVGMGKMKLIMGLTRIFRVLKKDLNFWNIDSLKSVSGMSKPQIIDIMEQYKNKGLIEKFTWNSDQILYKLIVN
jgi:hypothetical protein